MEGGGGKEGEVGCWERRPRRRAPQRSPHRLPAGHSPPKELPRQGVQLGGRGRQGVVGGGGRRAHTDRGESLLVQTSINREDTSRGGEYLTAAWGVL